MKQCNKLVAGVGINDAGYDVVKFDQSRNTGKRSAKVIWKCPFYSTWVNMLSRAYGSKIRLDCPTYLDIEVVKEWHTFSTFKAWMLTQDWQGKCLDKDILYHGNKVYGPATCCFVSVAVNMFVTDGRSRRRSDSIGLPTGVSLQDDRIYGHFYHIDREQRRAVRADSIEEAHLVWAESKLAAVDELAYRERLDSRVHQALTARYTMIVYRAKRKLNQAKEAALPLAA